MPINKLRLPTNATENITGALSLTRYIQEVSDGWFMQMILFAVAVIIFISLKNYSSSKAFITAAFFNMILTIIARALQLTTNLWMYLSIIFVGVGIVWLHLENSSGT